MADGVIGKTGENATLSVETVKESVSALVPVPLHLKSRLGAQDPARKQGRVTMDHAMNQSQVVQKVGYIMETLVSWSSTFQSGSGKMPDETAKNWEEISLKLHPPPKISFS